MDERTISYLFFSSLAALVGGPLALRRGRRRHAGAPPHRVDFGQRLTAPAHLEVLARPALPLHQ